MFFTGAEMTIAFLDWALVFLWVALLFVWIFLIIGAPTDGLFWRAALSAVGTLFLLAGALVRVRSS